MTLKEKIKEIRAAYKEVEPQLEALAAWFETELEDVARRKETNRILNKGMIAFKFPEKDDTTVIFKYMPHEKLFHISIYPAATSAVKISLADDAKGKEDCLTYLANLWA